jgi:hypothetical protein
VPIRAGRKAGRRLALAAAGVVIFAGAVVAGVAFDEYVEAGAPAATDRASVALLADGTEMLGTWEITYPKVLRANQDGALDIRYRSDRPWLLEQHPIELSATVGANALKLSDPATHLFDIARIKGTGADARSWIVTPTAEGDYNINVTLFADSEALDLEMRPLVMINDEIRQDDHAFQFLLPVSVATQWGISQRLFDLIRYGVMALGFVLTLPFLQTMLGALLAGRGQPPGQSG